MPLEVGGALRLRLEAVGRNHPPSLKLRRGKEDSRLRLMASARQGGQGTKGRLGN
jgi:hypothetical protein